jgi:hypothetical protein
MEAHQERLPMAAQPCRRSMAVVAGLEGRLQRGCGTRMSTTVQGR